jgi:adenine-specific DNA glycosylase
VFDFCATHGNLVRPNRTARQNKREIHYALDFRNAAVFLMQRPRHASLMPGMWELPEIAGPSGGPAWLTLRHSITVTDYTVRVRKEIASQNVSGEWIAQSRLHSLALTGLARKILKAAQII